MTLLVQNSLSAERQRGLVFCERFDSIEAFYKNGGTVAAGTPIFGKNNCYFDGSTRLTYTTGNSSVFGSSPFTLMAILKPTNMSPITYGLAVTVGFPTTAQSAYLGTYSSTIHFGGGVYSTDLHNASYVYDLFLPEQIQQLKLRI